MLDAVYVLVPLSVPSLVVFETGQCMGDVDAPELPCMLWLLEGEVQEPWFDERNVVLRASSRTLWANQVYSLNKIAISAARDAMCLKKHLRPPALCVE